MNADQDVFETSLINPSTETSDEERDNYQERIVFNFGGPQSNEEDRGQALQEAASFNSQSQSSQSPLGGPIEPITFNFGPHPIEAPEAEFVASLASGSKRLQMPLGIRELAASINNKRRAAATSRAFRGGTTAYIDQDESGTYDPKKARRTPPTPSRPAKRVKASTVDEDGNPKAKKQPKEIGFRYSLVIKLNLKSQKAKEYLRSLPAGTSGPLPGNFEEEEDVESDDHGQVGPFKRKREVKRPRRLGATVDRSDGLTIDHLTSGHPQRRGCRCCFQQGNDGCSLIDHPDEYPCEACEDAGVDCIFIVPPAFKKACLRCKDKRRNCSYTLDGGKSVHSCDKCVEEGVACCAEPLTECSMVRRFANLPARTKPEPKSTPALVPAKEPTKPTEPMNDIKDRLYVACNQCRSASKRCSHRGKVDPGPCSNCRNSKQACKFVYALTRTQHSPVSSSAKNKKTFASSSTHSSTLAREGTGTPHSPTTFTETLYSELEKKNTRKAEKLIRKGIAHIHITTSFCHPITFNYVPDPRMRNPCSWCDNPFFGLWGLASTSGPRKVEGFYHSDGYGFEEVCGGFSELEYSRSVMCIACTYARVRITQCSSHRLRTLEPTRGEIDMRSFDDRKWGEAVEAYKKGDETGAELVWGAKWCSICPAAAALKCCSAQLFDENGEAVPPHQNTGDGSGAGGDGCGFLLCEDCAELMVKLIKGGARTGSKQIDAICREVKRNHWRYAEGVRADAEFLTSAGELLMRIDQGMGASEGKVDAEGKMRMSKMEGDGGWIGGGFDREWDRKRDRKRDGKRDGETKSKLEADGDGIGGVKRAGMVNGNGKWKDGDIVEKAWAQYQAREEAARQSSKTEALNSKTTSNTIGSRGDRANGTAAGRAQGHRGVPGLFNSQSRPAASNSSSGLRNSSGPQSNERRSGNGSASGDRQFQPENASQRPQNPSGDTRSMAPPPESIRTGHSSIGAGNRGESGVSVLKRERDTRGKIMLGGLLKLKGEEGGC